MDGVGLLPLKIAEVLERGGTVVTGNQRAARALRLGFDRRNRELGIASWAPPDVMAWDTWMAALWRGLVVEGKVTQLLMNRSQEHAVWRRILEADKDLASLRSVDSLAEMAAEAWRLLCSYEGRARLKTGGWNGDARAFQRWALSFERVCRAEGLLAEVQLEETLREAVANGTMEAAAGEVALVGFDVLTPAQESLVEALRLVGMKVDELRLQIEPEERVVTEAADEDEEVAAAARWIRSFLEERPAAKVAVIVPALETERWEIDRVFRAVMAPELQDIRAAGQVGPFEFSVGVPLAETPMVAVALDLLRWAEEALPLERVSDLLLSPYFAMSGEERGVRAEFDAFELRRARMLRPEISLEDLVTAVERSKRKSRLSRLFAALRAMRGEANRLRGLDARTHGAWAERMRELLKAAAWGSEAAQSSLEFQMRRKWEGALDELATLDFDDVRVEFVQALEALERIARETMFAPESREAPVQVMGPLEAAGGCFDAVWFLRAGELSWPMETRSNALLPWPVQREIAMPGTDAARDDEYARRVTDRTARSAATVVFSFAAHTADGRQRVSSLVRELGLKEITAAEIAPAAAMPVAVKLEAIEDVARVQPLPDWVIRGGARILELQAACGFRAFAEQRLWATQPESIEAGMDARESGTVIHEVLKLFWDNVQTQRALKSMTVEERDDVLNWCFNEALKRTESASATPWDAAYLEVQRGRLHRLMSWWLELEAERKTPFAVKTSEKDFRDVQVGPLRLNIRMDRVDEVEDGEVLIDYKTGTASPSEWLTDRPDAPQLPLYAILSDAERLQGVAFGLVRAGEGRGLKGYAVRDEVLHGTRATMTEASTLEAQVERWRQVLVKLAEEFAAGDARVRPKLYPKTCAFCRQRLLCRLDVSLLEADEEDDAAEDSERG
jgi:ATP-dependent helicase/nuclease subunit B